MDIRKEDFKAWLMKKDADASVGVARDSKGCPIARWVSESVGGVEVDVGYAQIRLPEGYKSIDTPLWVRQIMRRVDSNADGRATKAGELLALYEYLYGEDASVTA